MLQFRSQGQILGPDGQRMSKSRGNVVDPDKQVSKLWRGYRPRVSVFRIPMAGWWSMG